MNWKYARWNWTPWYEARPARPFKRGGPVAKPMRMVVLKDTYIVGINTLTMWLQMKARVDRGEIGGPNDGA